MTLLDQGARVGTAGFVLARLLLEPPNQALAGNFASPQMRETWPLSDPDSAEALASLEPDRYETLPRDHTTLFRRRPPLVPLHESAWRRDVDPAALRVDLTAAYEGANFTALPSPVDDNVGYQLAYLADGATRLAQAAAADDAASARTTAQTALRLRREHLDTFVAPLLAAIEQHARTRLYRAVPGLTRGFLTAHSALCRTSTE